MKWAPPSKRMGGLLVLAALGATLAGQCSPSSDRAAATGRGQASLPVSTIVGAGTSHASSGEDGRTLLMAAASIAPHHDPTVPPAADTRVAIEFGAPVHAPARPASAALHPDTQQLPASALARAADPVPAPEPARDAKAEPAGQLLLLDMTVNGTHRGPALLMVDERGVLHAQADTLVQWGMRTPMPEPIEVSGRAFHGFGALPGVRTAMVMEDMSGSAQIPARYLSNTTRSLAWGESIAPRADTGAFLDYDLSYTDDPGLQARQLSGLFHPTLFTSAGNLSAGFLHRDLDGPIDPPVEGTVRLDTTWTTDFPGLMASLRVGDALTPQNTWARSVRFGGIQWATNFATQPTLITFPQPAISGSAAVPTAMDIFVNGSLRASQDLPDGTFRIEDIPVVTGAGQIQVVTRDIMGREQLVVQDFYAAQQLLRPGLSDYALSLGALRQDYAIRSNEYSDVMLSAMARRGITSNFTLEGRLDATADTQVASAGAALSLTRFGVLSTSFALSKYNDTGTLWQLGHQYIGSRFRFDLRVQGTSRDFAQPGIEIDNAFPRLQSLVSGGSNFGYAGTLGLSLVDERFHDPQYDRRLLTLSYTRPLPDQFSLYLSGSLVQAGESELQASLLLMKFFGGRRSASASWQQSDAHQSARVEYRQDVPTGPGFGFRAAAFAGDSDALEAETTWHTRHNRLQAEVRSLEGETGWRASASGSLAWMGGSWYANREIRDGFAVVDAGGFEGVRVYLENREMGETDGQGRLLIPGLLPYQANRISIDSRDLPLSARVSQTQQSVAPYYRAGALVAFDVAERSDALLRVSWPDGTAIPEGSEAQIVGRPEIYPVGRQGRIYLPDLVGESRLQIRNHVWRCHIDLPNVSRRATEVLRDLGQFTCVDELQ